MSIQRSNPTPAAPEVIRAGRLPDVSADAMRPPKRLKGDIRRDGFMGLVGAKNPQDVESDNACRTMEQLYTEAMNARIMVNAGVRQGFALTARTCASIAQAVRYLDPASLEYPSIADAAARSQAQVVDANLAIGDQQVMLTLAIMGRRRMYYEE